MTSIEFAHIYLDEEISDEHIEGKQKLLEIWSNESPKTPVVLIDDYNALDNKLDLSLFKKFLDEGLDKEVMIFYESDMIFITPQTLKLLHNRDKKSYQRYIRDNNRYPCSLLAMSFYLLRLGIIQGHGRYINLNPSNRLINILSTRFKDVEDMIIRRLARSKLSGVEKSIETVYIKSSHGLFKPSV